MHLEAEPRWAARLPMRAIFAPLLVAQAVALLFAALQLVRGLHAACVGGRREDGRRQRSGGSYDGDPDGALACFEFCSFATRGMRLAGWWSADDELRAERRGLAAAILPGYNTFQGTPPSHIRKMRKGELAHEVVQLQAALVDQAERAKVQKQELDRIQQVTSLPSSLLPYLLSYPSPSRCSSLTGGSGAHAQQERLLCRICFERDIAVVVLPCRHRVLCSGCASKCKQCPICRGPIDERMVVFDA
eukprot:SM000047S16884  [mRNA]  locus=s47:560714:562654:+ [translate_table: standard]